MKSTFFKMILGMLCILMIITTVNASEKGSIRVRVVDVEQGTVMSGVPITISSPSMMGTKTSISNIDGEALFINITPGIYKVKSELKGFKTMVSTNVRVSLNAETVVDVKMEMAKIEETVTVTADVPEVNTTKSTIAEHVTSEEVESLPVARDFVGYLQLAAGVNIVPNSQGGDTPEDPAGKGGMNYSDRGTQGVSDSVGDGKRGSRDNQYFLDGMNITGMSSQTALMSFNNEVIQEQELMTSGVPAEYGGGKGVVGNIVTKSGGNNLSGSINLYAQSKGFYLPYGGSEYNGLKSNNLGEETMLEGYKDNKYDSAFTLGGPIMKDKIWFFVSGQYRNGSSDFNLSRSASSTEELVDFSSKRSGLFSKMSLKLSQNDSFNFMLFLDDQTREGERDKNIIKSQHRKEDFESGVYSGYYQRVLADNLIVDFRYGHYWWSWNRGSRYGDAGIPDSLLYMAGTYPEIEDYTFGGFTGTARDDKNTRDQFHFNLEWFPGKMRIKAGFMYSSENDKDDIFNEFGEQRSSLDPNLSGITLGEIYDTELFARSEVDERLLPYLNSNWDSTAAALDLNGNGVVALDELLQATFSTMGDNGLNFWRTWDAKRGANKVKARRMAAYVMDDWKLNQFLTINAGLRAEKHHYLNSEGGDILNMDWVFLPRFGLVWDIGGKGSHKLTAFYGHFSDPMPFAMIHFAGNISGRVSHEQMYLNNSWYTYRVRGSAEHRDAVWTPNTKDSFSREFSLTHEIALGNGLVLASQGYFRQDRNIIEDYDLFTYVDHYQGDPTWGHLALNFSDFGYPDSGPPGEANYFLSNLIGAKRDIYGLDFEISKRFKNGSNLVVQYSFKHAEGNSQSDGNADLQGDFINLDPRNAWMMGPTPGSIPHKVKVFGTYRTKFGLDIGALFYWNTGWKYTESYVFLPGRYDIYYNWQNDDSSYADTGQMQTPAYYQLDLKFNYRINLSERIGLDLFLDVYNITNNQAPFDVQYGRNDPTWAFRETTEILLPMRVYLGARLRF
jgi:TonB dependent receptor-like, beta-barrel/Carboxypeptidase regulatory-like domain